MRKVTLVFMVAGVFMLVGGSAAAPAFVPCDCDLNGDGNVSLPDVALFAADYYSPTHMPRSDFDGNGDVGLEDVGLLATAIGVSGC